MITWNYLKGIKTFRLSSYIFPHISNHRFICDESVEGGLRYKLDFVKDLLMKIGSKAKRYGQRLSAHPGHFNQIGTKSETVLTNKLFITLQLQSSYRNNNLTYKNSNLLDDKDIILSFKLNIISSKLTKTTHYNTYQQKLYRLIKFLKEERNISFNGISLILDQKNYKSIRTNKILKPHNLDSSYRKGKVRENRIEREFESKIEDLKLKILNTSSNILSKSCKFGI